MVDLGKLEDSSPGANGSVKLLGTVEGSLLRGKYAALPDTTEGWSDTWHCMRLLTG